MTKTDSIGDVDSGPASSPVNRGETSSRFALGADSRCGDGHLSFNLVSGRRWSAGSPLHPQDIAQDIAETAKCSHTLHKRAAKYPTSTRPPGACSLTGASQSCRARIRVSAFSEFLNCTTRNDRRTRRARRARDGMSLALFTRSRDDLPRRTNEQRW